MIQNAGVSRGGISTQLENYPLSKLKKNVSGIVSYLQFQDSIHFTEVSTIGMLRKVGDICPLRGVFSMLFASPASHVNSTVVTWWWWTLPTHPLSRPLQIYPGTPSCNGSRVCLHFGVCSMLLAVFRVGSPTRTVTL